MKMINFLFDHYIIIILFTFTIFLFHRCFNDVRKLSEISRMRNILNYKDIRFVLLPCSVLYFYFFLDFPEILVTHVKDPYVVYFLTSLERRVLILSLLFSILLSIILLVSIFENSLKNYRYFLFNGYCIFFSWFFILLLLLFTFSCILWGCAFVIYIYEHKEFLLRLLDKNLEKFFPFSKKASGPSEDFPQLDLLWNAPNESHRSIENSEKSRNKPAQMQRAREGIKSHVQSRALGSQSRIETIHRVSMVSSTSHTHQI